MISGNNKYLSKMLQITFKYLTKLSTLDVICTSFLYFIDVIIFLLLIVWKSRLYGSFIF